MYGIVITPVKKKVKRRIATKTPAAEVKAKEKKPAAKATEKDLVASAIAKLQVANEMQMKLLREEIKKIQLTSPTPPVEWIFDIVRDETGLIRQIKASAPKTGKKLH